jgi:hypothetical protein
MVKSHWRSQYYKTGRLRGNPYLSGLPTFSPQLVPLHLRLEMPDRLRPNTSLLTSLDDAGVNDNAAVNTFAINLQKKTNGSEYNLPDIVRLYRQHSEVSRMSV